MRISSAKKPLKCNTFHLPVNVCMCNARQWKWKNLPRIPLKSQIQDRNQLHHLLTMKEKYLSAKKPWKNHEWKPRVNIDRFYWHKVEEKTGASICVYVCMYACRCVCVYRYMKWKNDSFRTYIFLIHTLHIQVTRTFLVSFNWLLGATSPYISSHIWKCDTETPELDLSHLKTPEWHHGKVLYRQKATK